MIVYVGTYTRRSFRIEAQTGRLAATGQVTAVPAAVCIVFRPD